MDALGSGAVRGAIPMDLAQPCGRDMLTDRTLTNQEEVRRRLHDAIPGGAHTYAKGDDQFPAEAPAALVRGSGCRVWDVDGPTSGDAGARLPAGR